MTSNAMTINFGDGNSGFQAGTVHGSVNAAFHHYPAPERPETPPTPSILIPFGRDSDFVERGEVLGKIEHSCSRPASRTALVGLGGVGKSQLAIEYAYRTQDRCSDTWVFWIHASNSARFEQSFRDIATFVKLPGRQNPKVNIFQLVHDWLQDRGKGPWLIILDNVDDAGFLTVPGTDGKAAATTMKSTDPRQLRSYIPHCQHGSVLVTSRSQGAALELVEDANIIAIEPMNERDAMCLFHKKLGHSVDEACINELAVALEYMPLAIVQAAAYVVQRRPRCSVRKYLDEFRNSDRRKATLLGLTSGGLRRDAEAKNSILISWQISFDYIRENRPSAADLLSLMSFCDRQGIPESLLRSQIDQIHLGGGDELNDAADNTGRVDSGNDSDSDSTERNSHYSDDDNFDEDIMTLRNFSFLTANEDGNTFEMHRLVQLATLEWLRFHGLYEQRRTQFLIKLGAEMPEGQYENWTKCQQLFPHAQSVSVERPAAQESMKEWATILYRAAWYAVSKGNVIEAEDLSVRAMKARKKIFDKDHEDLIWAKAMVASALNLRGRWSEAEELEVQVVETRKRKLGADHPDTLTSMANLALTYWHQGRWDGAETLQVQVVETRKRKLGEDHPDTLTSMHNLAYTVKSLGRHREALDLMGCCLSLRRLVLGSQHLDTRSSKNAIELWQQDD
ncbi:hypothetical protein NLG97_g107 [Lecanicillium saksenae]|uniref:Uncharacterized protein n=1 Tax=Lecanicillium saksenae TaxID=468837 RepID=A0ACC1R7G2_9HYPO|nr:hypothetical protein NLG97_g107 [Lecanicillium saksenae]